ncbi:MAG: putative rane protein, partial [Pedosphaera sp.]|nr:putative rane protein [Pedosphaera sp.]
MVKFIKEGWELLKATVKHWQADNAPRLGAALAYYGVLALPPILVILLFIVSLFYNSQAASSQVSQQLGTVLGQQNAQYVQKLMSSTQVHGKGPVATGIAIVVLILSATGFFVELQSDLDSAWGVEQKSDIGWLGLIVNRVLSFVLLIAIGILLVSSVLASTALTAVQGSVGSSFPGGTVLWRSVDLLVSCGIITVLFAMIYKFLPDARVRWRDVWAGALLTAILFTVGKFLLGL